MLAIKDYLKIEYGYEKKSTKPICSSEYRKYINIFGLYFPLVAGKIEKETIFSVADDYRDGINSKMTKDEIFEYIIANQEKARRLKVKRYIVNEIIERMKSNTRRLSLNEAIVAYPNFEPNRLKRYCEEGRVIGEIENNEIVGIGIYTRITDCFNEISIKVNEAFRNQGIGKAIVSKMAMETLQKNKLLVYVSEEINLPSRKVIERIGSGYVQDEEIVFGIKKPI